MQNSPERLFDGIVSALTADVLPALEDPYARAQVLAAAELLRNLASRVEWRCADMRDTIDAIREVLAAAPDPVPILAEPVPSANAALAQSLGEHLAALARLQDSATDAVREPLRAFLAWQLEHEALLLRTGMYRG